MDRPPGGYYRIRSAVVVFPTPCAIRGDENYIGGAVGGRWRKIRGKSSQALAGCCRTILWDFFKCFVWIVAGGPRAGGVVNSRLFFSVLTAPKRDFESGEIVINGEGLSGFASEFLKP